MESHEITLIPKTEGKTLEVIDQIQDMNTNPNLDKVLEYEKTYKQFLKGIQREWRSHDERDVTSVESQEILRSLEDLIVSTVTAYNNVSLEKLNGDQYDYQEIRRVMIDSLGDAVGTYFDRVDTYEAAEVVVDKIFDIKNDGDTLVVLKRITPFFNRMLRSGTYGVNVESVSGEEVPRLKQFVDEKNLWEIFNQDRDALIGLVNHIRKDPSVLVEK